MVYNLMFMQTDDLIVSTWFWVVFNGFADWSAISEPCSARIAGGSRGISGGVVRGHKPLCHSRKANNHYAQGHPVGEEDPWREGLNQIIRRRRCIVWFNPDSDNIVKLRLYVEHVEFGWILTVIIRQTTMILRKFHSFSLVVASIGWYSWMHIYCASFVAGWSGK